MVAGVLLLSVITKLRSNSSVLADYFVPQRLRGATATTLITAESLATFGLLWAAPISQVGGALAFALLIAFTLGAAIRYLVRGDRGDCHCFGALRERLSWLTFVRNAVLLTLSAIAISHPGPNLLADAIGQLLPGVLIAAGCALVYAQAVRLFGLEVAPPERQTEARELGERHELQVLTP